MRTETWKACVSCGRDTRNRCQICAICLRGSREQEEALKQKCGPIEEDRDYCVALDVAESLRDLTE